MLLDSSRQTLLDVLADVPVPVVDHEPLPGQQPAPFVSLWLDGWDREFWRWEIRLYVDPGVGARAAQDQIAELGTTIDAALPQWMGRDEMRVEFVEQVGLLVAAWPCGVVRSY